MEKNQFYTGLLQGMMGEGNFPTDPVAREDEIYWRLGELVEENAITEEESMGCWMQYINQTRPDTVVIHLGRTVAKPFYE